MNIFAVISLIPQPAMQARVASNYASNFIELSPSAWLVAARGTAEDVSRVLGLTSGEMDSTVIVTMSDYHGRAPVNIWSWIEAKLEAPADG